MLAHESQLTVLELFEKQAGSAPDLVALCRGEDELSYGDLLTLVRRLAAGLRAAGVQPGQTVAVDGGRSVATMACLLGTMWSGAVLLPLDPTQSATRKSELLAEADAVLLLLPDATPGGATDELPGGVRALTAAELEALSADAVVPQPPSPQSASYLFFTSGTTGRPRGLVGRHSSLSHFIAWAARHFGLGPGDRVGQLSALTFDGVLKDLLPALTSGATVCLPPMDRPFDDTEPLMAWIGHARLTVLQTVPSVFGALLATDARTTADLSALRLILLSGDLLQGTLVTQWRAAFPDVTARMFNLYGTTEATILKSCYPIPEVIGEGALPVGKGIQGAQLLVVDELGRLCGPGELGEVLIRSPHLVLGRLRPAAGEPPLFEVNPFRPDDPDDLVQRTGDLGRYTPEGDVVIIGRRDDQVKVRGVRVQPDEVGAILADHPGLQAAAVVSRRNQRGETELVAYVVPAADASITPQDVRDTVAERLSTAVVPSHVVVLDALPLTLHGKLDRRALPTPPVPAADHGDGPAWESPTEQAVAEIWAEVLDCAPPPRTADFFSLGGHSLLMVRVLSRLRRDFGVDLPLHRFFDAPTVPALATAVDEVRRAPGPAPQDESIVPLPRTGPIPLSPEQEGVWFLEQQVPQGSAYNMAGLFELPAGIGDDLVGSALERVAARHEALRTAVVEVDGRPVQEVLPPDGVDFRPLPPVADEASALARLAAEAAVPFALEQGRLFRARLITIEDESPRRLLGITVHHIVCDGWSLELVADELDALLASALKGRPVEEPATTPLQYADHVLWNHSHRDETRESADADFWRDHLGASTPVLDLPTSRPRPAVRTHNGATRRIEAPPTLAGRLEEFCRRHGATTYMAVVAAFGLVLAQASGEDCVVLGTDDAGRERPETEEVVGFFVRTHAYRLDLGGDPSFTDALARVKAAVLSAHEHRHLAWAKVVEALKPERDASRTPLFQAMVRMPPRNVTAADRRVLRPVDVIGATDAAGIPALVPAAKFDLTLAATEGPAGIHFDLEYNTDLFDADLADVLGRRVVTLLEAAVLSPERPGSTLARPTPHPFAQEVERRTHPRVFDEFTRAAAEAPDSEAVRIGEHSLSYQDLAATVASIAPSLEPGRTVAVLGGKHPSSIAAVLAALARGTVFVPIDEELPPERQQQMARISGATLVLATGHDRDPQWPGAAGLPVAHATERTAEPAATVRPPSPAGPGGSSDDRPAYVFFTSGTTGTPKGVLGSHAGLDHFISWEREEFGITRADRFAQLTSFSFDAVLRDLLVPLCAGASVHIPPQRERDDTLRLIEWIAAERISVVHTTPSVLSSWLALAEDAADVKLPELRLVALSGEPLTDAVVHRFRALFPDCDAELVSLYGATETTMIKSFQRVQDPLPGPGQPIGRPLPGTQIIVLGKDGQECLPGERGEIVVRTPYRTLGYLGPTAPDAFRPNPHRTDPSDLLYYTGDVGVVHTDHSVTPQGRSNGMVKLRGVSVHPAEVAAAIGTHPEVGSAVVLPHEDDGRTELVGYVVRTAGSALTTQALRDHLTQRLPAPVVPGLLFFLDSLPMLPNGKVDQTALRGRTETVRKQAVHLAPRNAAETRLLRIWQSVLRTEEIGVEDDFFASGGHSLLATILITRIRRETGAELTLRDLLRAPRIDQLAQVIARLTAEREDDDHGALVTLRPGPASATPLFLVHPIGGDVIAYRDLARLLPGDRPVYAFRAPGLDGGSLYSDVREMAAVYLHELREVQPQGPYALAGWSLGGIVAYEIARQLSFDGETAALLAMVDSYAPGSPAFDGFDGAPADHLPSFAADVERVAGAPAAADLGRLLDPAGEGEDDTLTELRRRFAVFHEHSVALGNYRGRRGKLTGTRTLLVVAQGQRRPAGVDAVLGWTEFLGAQPQTVTVTDADHYDVVAPPAVRTTAEAIGRELDSLLP
ncbi:hypothetical protein BG452_05505 [Streptomyces sp. CBMA123]|nr:hypothetical protein [Streptomyces sp. CBMA123]